MLRIWRADRCVQGSSTGLYLQWIKRFRAYCARYGLDERVELTLSGAQHFIASYARLRGLDAQRLGAARTALYALSRVYQVMALHSPTPALLLLVALKIAFDLGSHVRERKKFATVASTVPQAANEVTSL